VIGPYLELLALLVIAHLLADYPLQGDFLAKAKNHTAPIPGVPPLIALLSHAVIHAGFVWLVTGSAVLGLAELLLHAAIDRTKCAGLMSFTHDQWLHFLCKVVYVAILTLGDLP
jgi:Protein of unknown function (DUF3307)